MTTNPAEFSDCRNPPGPARMSPCSTTWRRRFLSEEIAPRYDEFEKAEMVDRDSWKKAGAAGLLCASMPEEYGGSGGTFAHESAIIEAIGHVGVDGFGIVAAQRHRRALHPPLRLRGAEEEVAAEAWRPAS